MNFECIVLTRKELQRLRKLAKSPRGLDSTPDETELMNQRLITRTRYGSPDSNSAILLSTISNISDDGRKYLLYRKNKRRQWWWSNGLQLINILLALIASVTGIIALIAK